MHCDNQTIFSGNEHHYATGEYDPGRVILELKCPVSQRPTWMLDLIALFDLKQGRFSKHANSTLVAGIDNGDACMNPMVYGARI